MRNLKVSLCYHPTTVIAVDDNKDYLKQLQPSLTESHPCLPFANPADALKYLNEIYQTEPFIDRCITMPISAEEMPDQFAAKIDIRTIQNELTLAKRFNEVSVVIVDYAMPGMNGIEFCKQIKDPNILIILLTGEADSAIAIKAFNDGVIDRFYEKTIPNLRNVLLQAIQELEKQYFVNLSNIIINQADPKILVALEDNNVANLFYKLCKDNHIAEYYIISDMGGFLCIDRQGRPSRLSIISNEQFSDLYDWAASGKVSSVVLTALKHKEKIPLFYTSHDIDSTAPAEWDDYLYSVHLVPGTSNYYYAYTKKLDACPKQLENILAYKDYLANVG